MSPEHKKEESHKDLVGYFATRYPEMSMSKLREQMLGEPDNFESSLKMMHKENYSSIDYQTFRTKYIKTYGDPFKPEPPGLSVKATQEPNAAADLRYEYDWGGQSPSKLETGDYATTVDRDFDPEQHARLAAYETLKSKRLGQSGMTGDEFAIETAENSEYIKARMNGRTAYEMAVGASEGQKREFDYRLNALGEEVASIDQASEYITGQLKSKYGDDFFERLNRQQLQRLIPGMPNIPPKAEDQKLAQDLAQDPLAQEIDTLRQIRSKNIARFKELMKADNYKLAREYGKSIEEVQKQIDESEDPMRGASSLVMRTFGKAVKSLGAIGQIAEGSLFGDDEYGASNALWDFFQESGQGLQDFYPMQSRNSRPLFTQTAEYESAGAKYQIDFKDGQPSAVRDQNGMLIKNPFSNTQMEEVRKLKPSEQVNWGAGVYKSADILADLGVQVLLSKGATGMMTKAGATKAFAAKAGVTMGVAGQMSGTMLDKGKELFPDDPSKASQYALATSTLIGLSANMFGLESKLAGGGGGFLDDLFGNSIFNQRMRSLATGKASPTSLAAATAVEFAKSGMGETFEETVLEDLIDRGVRAIMGGKQDNVDMGEVAETAALSFAVGILGGAGNATSDLQKGALEIIADNPDAYKTQLNTLAKAGVIRIPGADPNSEGYESKVNEYVAEQQQRAEELGSSYRAIQPFVPKAPKSEVIALLDKKRGNQKEIKRLEAAGITQGVESLEAENAQVEQQLEKLSEGAIRFKTAEDIKAEEIYKPVSLNKPVKESTEEVKEETEPQGLVQAPASELEGRRVTVTGKGSGVVGRNPEGALQVQRPDAEPIPLDENKTAEEQNVVVRERPALTVNPGETVTINEKEYDVDDVFADETGYQALQVTNRDTGETTVINDPVLAQEYQAQLYDAAGEGQVQQAVSSEIGSTQTDAVGSMLSAAPESVKKALTANQKAFVTGGNMDTGSLNEEESREAVAWMRETAQAFSENSNPVVQKIGENLNNLADAYERDTGTDAVRARPGETGEADPQPQAPTRGGRRVEITDETDIDGLIQAAQEMGYDTQEIADKVEFLQSQAEDGSAKAQKALQAQENLLRQELTGDAEWEGQQDFDSKVTHAGKLADLKGLGSTQYEARRGTKPEEGYDIDQELRALGEAEPAPGSPLSPEMPELPNTDTVEGKAEAISSTHAAIEGTQEAIEYTRRDAANQDFDGLTGEDLAEAIEQAQELATADLEIKLGKLRTRLKRLRDSEAAVIPSGHKNEQDYKERIAEEAAPGVQIKGASLGFTMGDLGFLDFLRGLVSDKTKIEMQIAAKKLWSNLRKYTVGNLPKTARLLNVERISAINSQMERGKILSKLLKREARKAGIDIRESGKFLNNLMSNPDLTSMSQVEMPDGSIMPEGLLNVIKQMRNHIDALSLELIHAGLTDGPLMNVITDNMGVYLHRSYQIHNDPDWVEKVQGDPEVWNPGIAWWTRELQAGRARLQAELDKSTGYLEAAEEKLDNLPPGASPDQTAKIEKRIDFWQDKLNTLNEQIDIVQSKIESPAASLEALLREQATMSTGGGGKLGSKDLGIFEMRGGKGRRDAVKEAQKILNKAKDKLESAHKKRESEPEKYEDALQEVADAQRGLAEAHKIDIPKPLRELYGEYESVLVNYMQTIHKQSALASNHTFLSKVRDAGLTQGWLRTPEDPQGPYTERIAAESKSVMSPLNGMLTTPDIAKAFEEYNQSMRLPGPLGGFLSGWMALSGITKKWLTVYSPVGNTRNINTGGYFHALAGDFLASPAGPAIYLNGILDAVGEGMRKVTKRATNKDVDFNYLKNSVIGPAIRAASERVAASDTVPKIVRDFVSAAGFQAGAASDTIEANKQAFRIGRDAKITEEQEIAQYEEYVALGLTDDSVEFGLVMASIRQFKEGFTSPYSQITPSKSVQAGMEAKEGVREFAQDTYQASDTAHRILRYMRDLRRYANSRGIRMEDLGPGQNMEFKQEVAAIARRTYPTYSRMPKIVSAIGKSPLIGPFISFHYTAAEAAVNNVVQGSKDIQNGDVGIGISRILGVAMSNIAYSAALKAIGGVMTGGLLGVATGAPEDEDTDANKWTYFLPPWSKYSKVSIFPTGNGDFLYVDHGSQVPNTALFEVIESSLQGDFDRAKDGMLKEIIGPFVGWDVFTQSALEASLNQKNLGTPREIYLEEDEWYNKRYKQVSHVLRRVQPGLFSTLGRIRIAANNYMGRPNYEDFKNYKLGVELLTTGTGIRVSTGDVGLSFTINGYTLNKQFNNGLSVYRRAANRLKRERPNISKPERMLRLEKKAEEARILATKSVQKIIAMYQAAQKTGLSQEELDRKLEKARFPKATREGIKMGVVVLPEVDNIKD